MARAAPILAVSKPSPLPLIAPSSRPRAGPLHLHRRRLLPLSPSSSCSTSTSASSSSSSPVLLRDDELDHQEEPPPASEADSRPRRIALFVEPSPFAYVSGYKNRFQNFIKYLREMGDEVIVITTHEGVPDEFHGAKLIGSWSFPCPWYQKVPLSLALSPRIIGEVARFKPDIIHASSPGIMVFGALIIAKLLCVPLVMSYHTHVPIYIPRYTFSWLVKPMWLVIKFLHRAADLTLVPSVAIGRDLQAARVTAGLHKHTYCFHVITSFQVPTSSSHGA
ncbi:unnamed protein product [Triticum turgidum subsp. durum]|uniref:Glycosyltransferase subfamily 4-like N-terminal domain-containing protein n=1 Tax=Triticum turgidum subsp. durum TaxID=4567 RepID=A0A9R1PNH4_TRITD|nr:unnamed protein product [Triticum turgidum subsp. durum]